MFKTITSALKGTLVYGLGNISIKLIGLILFPLYTEKFTVEEYGVIGILDISSQVLVAILGLSLSSALFRFYFDKKYSGKQGELVFSTLSILIVLCLGFVLIVSNFSAGISSLLFESLDFEKLVRIILIAAALQVVNNIPTTVLRLKEKARLYAITNVLKVTVILVTTIVFIVKMNYGILGIYYGQICGSLVYLIVLSGFLLKNSTFRFNRPALSEMLAFSTPLIFSSLAAVTLTVLDRYSLNFLVGLEDVGIYSTGYKIANILLFVVMASQLALPTILFKNMEEKNNKRLYSKVMTYNTYAMMGLVIFMSVFGLEIVKVLASNPDYWSGYIIIPFISLSILFNSMRYLLTLNLSIVKKTVVVAVIVTLMSALNLGLNILLIPLYQAMGAAVATMLTQLIFLLTTYFVAQRYYYVPYELKKLLIILLVGLLFIFLGFITNELALYLRIIIKLALCLLFPVVLYFMKFYEEIELTRIREILKLLVHPKRLLQSLKNQE
jgi:O-antigen/teichoic acid export membrane protein